MSPRCQDTRERAIRVVRAREVFLVTRRAQALRDAREGSFLEAFLETALTLAAGNIAGHFAKAFSKHLEHYIGKVVDPVAKLEVKQDLKIVSVASDAVKEGLNAITRPAVKGVAGMGKPEPGQTPTPSGFFRAQASALTEEINSNRQLLTNTKFKLQPQLARSPHLIVASMEATLRSLEAAKAEARAQQLLATESQWIAAVASTDHSIQRDLEGVRNPHASVAPEGVLRLHVNVVDGRHVVSSAKLPGIGKAIVAQMSGIPLRNVPIPVALHVLSTKGKATVTRDERGTIRVEGALPGKDRDVSEPDKLDDAEALVARILSKSLNDWGVTVQHDDNAKESERLAPE